MNQITIRRVKVTRKKDMDPLDTLQGVSKLLGSRRFKYRLCPVCKQGEVSETWKEECTGCYFRAKTDNMKFEFL